MTIIKDTPKKHLCAPAGSTRTWIPGRQYIEQHQNRRWPSHVSSSLAFRTAEQQVLCSSSLAYD